MVKVNFFFFKNISSNLCVKDVFFFQNITDCNAQARTSPLRFITNAHTPSLDRCLPLHLYI